MLISSSDLDGSMLASPGLAEPIDPHGPSRRPGLAQRRPAERRLATPPHPHGRGSDRTGSVFFGRPIGLVIWMSSITRHRLERYISLA